LFDWLARSLAEVRFDAELPPRIARQKGLSDRSGAGRRGRQNMAAGETATNEEGRRRDVPHPSIRSANL
jgi:hypothetical protein